MSYLDVPRLHFSGNFFADPSTINNEASNYTTPVAAIDSLLSAPTLSPSGSLLWNPRGKHWFFFNNCAVRRCLDNTGAEKNSAADDALVTGSVETTNSPAFAKLVDLDPEIQQVSQIFGVEIKVSLSNGRGFFRGVMATGTLRDLWFGRAGGGMSGAGGVYQSEITGITWDTSSRSPVFDQLFAASGSKLSIKFVLYAYDANPGPDVNPPPLPPPNFTKGKVVGTIGPVLPSEPAHFLAARQLTDGSNGPAVTQRNVWSGGFGPAYFKVDTARNKLIVDLGNAIPETTPGGPRRDIGTLGAGSIGVGPLLFSNSFDYLTSHYEQTAGIEELSLSASEAASLASNRLVLVCTKPAASVILTERPSGRFVDASQIALRINPGESKLVEFAATVFGAARSGQVIGLKLLSGSPPAGLAAPANLTAGTTITTGANGRASVTFTGGTPGNPRPGLDGQLYKVGFYWGPASAGDLRGVIFIHAFSSFPAVAAPTFAHVRPILEEYNKIYPFMKLRLDLGNHAAIQSYRSGAAGDPNKLKLMVGLSEDDPRYMPVTRDLSRDKRNLLIAWLNRGAPP